MRYHLLGRSGLRVSEVALGTMTFGEEWGWGSDQAEARRIFDAYVAAGGNFIDTADRYTEGTSERWVGDFVREDRERFVVATKYTLVTRPGDPNGAGNHRKHMVHALDASLKRLGLDFVDLYWVHAWDFTVAPDEVMRALDDQVRAGKVLHVGFSDTPAWLVSRAHTIAELRGWTPLTALQVEHSLVERTVERELLPMARALGLGVTPWSPLASGLLSGKYADGLPEGTRLKEGSLRLVPRNLAIAREVAAVARELGTTSSRVAIAWLRQQAPASIPILGARTLAHLEDNLGALALVLPDEHKARLDAVSAVEPGFPQEFLSRDYVAKMVYAGTRERLVGLNPAAGG
jgi:aryl-alcohol dehydrogenase-like predicted oxidoreductase